MFKCECEHEAHTATTGTTPNGNPGHRFGQTFSDLVEFTVKTPHGTYRLCADCRFDCYHAYPDSEAT